MAPKDEESEQKPRKKENKELRTSAQTSLQKSAIKLEHNSLSNNDVQNMSRNEPFVKKIVSTETSLPGASIPGDKSSLQIREILNDTVPCEDISRLTRRVHVQEVNSDVR